MPKYRAVLFAGSSVSQVKRGPIRDTNREASLDKPKLENHYVGQASVFKEGDSLFEGPTDSIFD